MTNELLKVQMAFLATINVTTSFVAFHRWAEAPDKVAFLRNWHRHKFNVRATFAVGHNDRDLEFFIIQERLNWVTERWVGREVEMSCEMFGQAIMEAMLKEGLPCMSVYVDEDGENGAALSLLSLSPPVQVFEIEVSAPQLAKLGATQPDLFPQVGPSH